MQPLLDQATPFAVLPVPMVPRARPGRHRRRPGRHPKPINWWFVSKAFQANATVEEVAAAVGLTTQHLRRRIRSDIDAEPAAEIERMRQVGRMELRMIQHATALNGAGSVQMLIWLGKQRLGQSDQAKRSDAGGSFLVITTGKMDPVEWEAAWAMCAAGVPEIQRPAEGSA